MFYRLKPEKLYIIRKVTMGAFQKCNFYCNRVTESNVMGNLSEILGCFGLFYHDQSLIILKSRDHGCQL